MKTIVTLALLIVFADAPAQVYRWVNEHGVTVYSQTPPPDRQADTYRAPAEPTDEAGAQQSLDRQSQEIDDYLEDRELAKEKRRQEKARDEVKKKNCAVARENLNNLEISAQRLTRLPDGSYVRLTEAERQAKLQETRKQIEEFCP